MRASVHAAILGLGKSSAVVRRVTSFVAELQEDAVPSSVAATVLNIHIIAAFHLRDLRNLREQLNISTCLTVFISPADSRPVFEVCVCV